MKLIRFLALAAFVLPVLVRAHPGHDDGHALTWDFDHLLAHPVATLVCFLVLAAGGWTIRQLMRSRLARERPARNRAETHR